MNKEFNKGLLLAGFGSFWWGFLGVLYFIDYHGYSDLLFSRHYLESTMGKLHSARCDRFGDDSFSNDIRRVIV